MNKHFNKERNKDLWEPRKENSSWNSMKTKCFSDFGTVSVAKDFN